MTQISPMSAAAHYATSAQFWEQQAKALRHELDGALARVAELEQREAELQATLKERDDDIAYALSKNAQAFQRHSPE